MASAPSKFDMGGMPRTRMGLVPTTFRRKMDALSSTKEWSPLPPKPKPPMYPYRGDYINERNRKLQRERNQIKKQNQQASINKDNDSIGSTLLISPRSAVESNSSPSLSIIGEGIPPYNRSNNWDSYCKHISFHKLSDDEQHARARNKNEFVSYLRSSAARRNGLKVSKATDEKKQQTSVPETIVRQCKPPVPRFSRVARTGEEMETHLNDSKTLSQTNPTVQLPTKVASKGYLDFISEKVKPLPKAAIAAKVYPNLRVVSKGSMPKSASNNNSNIKYNTIEDDEIFRNQIDRIVERAHEMMVLKGKHHGDGTAGLTTLNEGVDTSTRRTAVENYHIDDDENTIDSRRWQSQWMEEMAERQTPRRDSSYYYPHTVRRFGTTKSNDYFRYQNEQLSFLEDQINSMSSSTVSESDLFSSSSYTASTSVDPCNDGNSTKDRRPRVQQPLPTSNHPQIPDTSSCATSNLTEFDSTSIDVSSVLNISSTNIGSSVDENSSPTEPIHDVHIQPTLTEPIHVNIQPAPALDDECFEEPLPQPVKPTIEPSRNIQWDEEPPLPRGHEYTMYEAHSNRNENPESLIEDLFSLMI